LNLRLPNANSCVSVWMWLSPAIASRHASRVKVGKGISAWKNHADKSLLPFRDPSSSERPCCDFTTGESCAGEAVVEGPSCSQKVYSKQILFHCLVNLVKSVTVC
jgi:hypothetical protein